jgi:hypothetical protein
VGTPCVLLEPVKAGGQRHEPGPCSDLDARTVADLIAAGVAVAVAPADASAAPRVGATPGATTAHATAAGHARADTTHAATRPGGAPSARRKAGGGSH